MERKSLCYHTRLRSNPAIKVCGGSFGGAIDAETVERLVNAFFAVVVKDSGHPVFVDREGREVYLYLSVDPAETSKGKAALATWRQAKYNAEVLAQQQAEEEDEELQDAMAGLSHDEIIRRLKGE